MAAPVPPPAAAVPAPPKVSVGLPCPACGGAVQVEEAARSTACPYCKSLLWVEGDAGVRRIMYRNMETRDGILGVARTWFRKGLKARDLVATAEVTEAYPVYVPFWRVPCLAAGWVCGWREETHTDSKGRTYTTRVYLERMVLREYDWSAPACEAGELGITELRYPDGPVTAQEQGIPMFEATTSPTDAEEAAVADAYRRALSSAGVPRVTFEKIHVIPRGQSLMFLPVWVVRYTYRGRSYFATFDGVTGESIAGRAPGDPLAQSLAMAAGATGGGLAIGLGIWAALGGMAESPAVPIAVGVLLGLLAWAGGFWFFRHGSEIVEGHLPREDVRVRRRRARA